MRNWNIVSRVINAVIRDENLKTTTKNLTYASNENTLTASGRDGRAAETARRQQRCLHQVHQNRLVVLALLIATTYQYLSR